MAEEKSFIVKGLKPFKVSSSFFRLLEKIKVLKITKEDDKDVVLFGDLAKEAIKIEKQEKRKIKLGEKSRKILTPIKARDIFRKLGEETKIAMDALKDSMSFKDPEAISEAEKDFRSKVEAQLIEQGLSKPKIEESVEAEVKEEVEEPKVEEPVETGVKEEVEEPKIDEPVETEEPKVEEPVEVEEPKIEVPSAYDDLDKARKENTNRELADQLVKETNVSDYWVTRALNATNNNIDLARNWLDDRGKLTYDVPVINKEYEELKNLIVKQDEKIDRLEETVKQLNELLSYSMEIGNVDGLKNDYLEKGKSL